MDEKRAQHILQRQQLVLLPEEKPTTWDWLERFVAAVEAAKREGSWPRLKEFTLETLIQPSCPWAGPHAATPQPSADSMPRLLRALPPSVKALNLGQFLPHVPVLAGLRCLEEEGGEGGKGVLPALEAFTLHFRMLPECVAGLCAALGSERSGLATSLKHLQLQGILMPKATARLEEYTDEVVTALLDALGTVQDRPLEWLFSAPRDAHCAFHHWYRLTALVIDGRLPHMREPIGSFPRRCSRRRPGRRGTASPRSWWRRLRPGASAA